MDSVPNTGSGFFMASLLPTTAQSQPLVRSLEVWKRLLCLKKDYVLVPAKDLFSSTENQ